MTAIKNNNQVFKRIKRITNPVVMESNRLGETLLLTLFIIGLCIFSANAQSGINNTDSTNHSQNENISDSLLHKDLSETIPVENNDKSESNNTCNAYL